MNIDKIMDAAIKRIRLAVYEEFIERIQNTKCTLQEYYDVIDSILEPSERGELQSFEYHEKSYLISADDIVYNKDLLIPIGFFDRTVNILIYNEL